MEQRRSIGEHEVRSTRVEDSESHGGHETRSVIETGAGSTAQIAAFDLDTAAYSDLR